MALYGTWPNVQQALDLLTYIEQGLAKSIFWSSRSSSSSSFSYDRISWVISGRSTFLLPTFSYNCSTRELSGLGPGVRGSISSLTRCQFLSMSLAVDKSDVTAWSLALTDARLMEVQARAPGGNQQAQ